MDQEKKMMQIGKKALLLRPKSYGKSILNNIYNEKNNCNH